MNMQQTANEQKADSQQEKNLRMQVPKNSSIEVLRRAKRHIRRVLDCMGPNGDLWMICTARGEAETRRNHG